MQSDRLHVVSVGAVRFLDQTERWRLKLEEEEELVSERVGVKGGKGCAVLSGVAAVTEDVRADNNGVTVGVSGGDRTDRCVGENVRGRFCPPSL